MGEYETRKNGFFLFWKGPLSQWRHSEFIVSGIKYRTAEHWMMAGKARLFNDSETLKEILESKTPSEAKDLGRLVEGFDLEVWNEHCFDIVVQGNLHKFTQNPVLREHLMNTGSHILVEASPFDAIWGIGLAQDHPDADNPGKWKGQNLLGMALMKVRAVLSEEK